MAALSLIYSKSLILNQSKSKLIYLNQLNRLFSNVNIKIIPNKCEKISFNEQQILLLNKKFQRNNLIIRFSSTETKAEPKLNEPVAKKQSKFKQFYTQYGPLFLVVHLTTVVMWIYGFYLLSKQGYDITQLLNVFHKMNLMAKETVQEIHHKIDNYKMESGWITGHNIKHFATAYMIYKVIAPFRYMVSIGIVRFIVKNLRAKGIIKS